MDISILEIRNAKSLMIDREWLAGIMPTAERIISGELHTEKTEKRLRARVTMAESGNQFLMSEPDNENHGTQVESNEAYLNIIFVEGLVTRNGGACTYGSKQMRNLIMQASDDDDCKGHVIILDTPGGLSSAIPDFKMAIDYANSKGLDVDGVIDGSCLSAGIYIGSMCNHLYYTSPSDRVGSVGTFAIIDVMKNGTVDPATGETHYEIYDPESYDKNAWYRQLSEEDKTDLIVEDLKRDGKEFRDYVKSRRPGCTDEMLHGKVYKCGEVEGSFVDGQRTLQEVFQEVMAHYYETHKQNASQQANTLSTTLNNNIMTEKYQTIAQLAGAADGKFEKVDADGVYMNTSLLDTLQANIEAAQKEKADALALVESLTAEKNELTAKVEELTAQAETKETEHAKAIEDLNAAHATAIEEKDNQISALEQEKADLQGDMEGKASQIETLTADLNGAKESLTTAQNTIAERDQQISDLNATIDEMKQDAGAGAQAGSPANNGSGAEAKGYVPNCYVYNNDLTYEQNCEAEKQWNEQHGK